MSQITIDQAMQIALQHHQAGQLQQAEQFYRQILAQAPNHAPSLHYLGMIAHQVGRYDVAVDLIRRAIAITPNDASAQNNLGNVLKDKGQIDEAVAAYRRAIVLHPNFSEAYNNLGIALKNNRQLDDAIGAFGQAILLRPEYVEPHYNLGNVLKDMGRLDAAIAAYRRAVALKPGYVEAHNDLGIALAGKGQFDEAVAAYRQAIALRPDFPQAQYNLANAMIATGHLDEAIAAFRQVILLTPNLPEAHSNLGSALKMSGKIQESIAAYRNAIALGPNLFEAHSNLGNALKIIGRFDEAISACRRAIALRPDYAQAYNNLGAALGDKRELDEAIAAYRHAIFLKHNYDEAHHNLGTALMEQGRIEDARIAFEQASALAPENPTFLSSVLMCLCYHPDYSDTMIFREHRRFEERHGQPSAKLIRPHANTRDPNRRLKIGYVSADFRDHIVGRNVLPLLQGHDHSRVEVFCYSNHVDRPDDPLTGLFRVSADVWRNIATQSDEQVCEMIRADGIDILVNLALHTTNNRLLVFARKPAPIQVTWAGYPGTTGLSAIDYRLTDPYLDPFDSAQEPGNPCRVGVPAHHFASTVGEYAHPTNESAGSEGQGPEGQGDAFYSERSIRLPHSFWCFRPTEGTPEVNPLPAMSNGFVTFGCLNNFCKVTEPALELWARVLQSANRSRLLIRSPSGSHREQVLMRFQDRGVDPHRIEFVNHLPFTQYMRRYHLIDIALDPLPYTGHSTSLDAFWMGVPVVTLAGRTVASRGGVSIASNLGMTELIAGTADQYVGIAERLAGDLTSLSGLRSTLRERMQSSALMNEERFARDIERAYREMWRRWCEAHE